MRTYLLELDALPEAPLVAMVPVGLNAKQSQVASAEGGNAVGSVMVQMATDKHDPADRLASIHRSMKDGKEALSSMTPVQILAMSALGQAPAILTPMLRMQGIVRPPYNVIISNVPGPRTTHYWNGAAAAPAPTRCRSPSTGWLSTSPARRTTARWRSGSPAAAGRCRTSSGC